jgi:hypothetical protein
MQVLKPTFSEISSTWEAAGDVVNDWIPELSGCFESRYSIATARRLLQAVVSHFRLTRSPKQCTVAGVRAALRDASHEFDPFFRDLIASEDQHVREIALEVAANLENPWYGGITQALLCIAEWRFPKEK